jgi:hypothetical protein
MLNSHWKYLLTLAIGFSSVVVQAQCNGNPDLCGRRYDQVSYLTTHNAFNAEEEGFNFPNHTYGLTRQLNDGVRGLMLDVYDEAGVATVYHSIAVLGTATLESNLTEIKDFLDANPNEVVTIIFECYADFELVETAFINTEALDYTWEQPLGEPWPTLQQMIDENKRLVVLSDRNDAAPGEDWYHYVWDFAVETPFSNSSNSDFTCEFNRGDENNDLFILNHFATDPNVGVGRTDLSELANEFDFFYHRARDCEATLGKFPNFPTVDFYELGNTLEVVDSLNGIPSSVGIEEKSPANSVSVFPNPSKDVFICSWVQPTAAQISLFDHAGVLVWQTFMNETSITIDLSPYPVGIYHVQVLSGEAVSTVKLVRN